MLWGGRWDQQKIHYGCPKFQFKQAEWTFYNFNELEDEDVGNAENNVENGNRGSALDQDSDGDDDAAIPKDDPGLQTLLGEQVPSSQPNQAYYYVPEVDATEGIEVTMKETIDGEEHNGHKRAHHLQWRHDKQSDAYGDQCEAHCKHRKGLCEQHNAHWDRRGLLSNYLLVVVPNFFKLP
jgi:hypothetical protein